MAVFSTGSATWTGDLVSGGGTVSASSGIFAGAPITWAARATDRSAGTSPEELLAAAHAGCFCMAFSARLGKNGTPPTKLEVTTSVGFTPGVGIHESNLVVKATVPGIAADKFQELAADAKDNCPVSKALASTVTVTVTASLA